MPDALETLIKWIIVGPKNVIDESPKKAKSVDDSVIWKLILKGVKTNKQVSHVTNEDFRNTNISETPLTVGLGQKTHHKTRSKHVIEGLFQLNLAITYKRILQIETSIGNAVYESMQKKWWCFHSKYASSFL